jgi:hypothetical protein
MKQVFITLVVIFLCIVFYWAGKENNKTDLEIYTKDNIYYIRGLTVSNEVDATVITFSSGEELKEYISNLTANKK